MRAMTSQKQTNLFINYTHPSQQKQKKNRQAISVFVSKKHRPAAPQIILKRSLYRPFSLRPGPNAGSGPSTAYAKSSSSEDSGDFASVRSNSDAESMASQDSLVHEPLRELVLGGSREDPFSSYPIESGQYLPYFSDYFIRYLTPRFTPALAIKKSRYVEWFNLALQNAELFHALIALSQIYHNIDHNGFGPPSMLSLYHRGKSLKMLRDKVAGCDTGGDEAAILTTVWLMDVDYAAGVKEGFAMHKQAEEQMVALRGGIEKLSPELQEELLKSEFFLPLQLYGRFVSETTEENALLIRFREHHPLSKFQLASMPQFFQHIARKGLLTSSMVNIINRITDQQTGIRGKTYSDESPPDSEITALREFVRPLAPESTDHALCLALLIYVFNLHNQKLIYDKHVQILNNVAIELVAIDPSVSISVRECTLWTVIAVGAASSFSPWRDKIPFMGHLIEQMEHEDELERLTSCLRGYYLYGASEEKLRAMS